MSEIRAEGQKSLYQKDIIKYITTFFDLQEKSIDLFREELKILAPKQMLQRLSIALAQVKAGNNAENLVNEIRQIVYSLYHSKEFTKKVCNNIIKSI